MVMVSGGGGPGFPELFVEFLRYNYFSDKLDDNVSKFLFQSGENYQGLDIPSDSPEEEVY